MKPLDVKKMLGNRTQPWFLLFELHISREEAKSFFSVDPVVSPEDFEGEGDYWALQCDCGLRISFEFFYSFPGGLVYANMPCPQHVRRHLKHWEHQLIPIPDEQTELDRNGMIDHFKNEIPDLLQTKTYQIWRQGDDGNPIAIGNPTTKNDAECWVSELESYPHKQLYWIEKSGAT